MKDELTSNIGTHSQRMVPDASGSQITQSTSALKKMRFDDDDYADETGKYRSRLQQHMAGLEQAYFSRRLNNTGYLYPLFCMQISSFFEKEKCWLKDSGKSEESI